MRFRTMILKAFPARPFTQGSYWLEGTPFQVNMGSMSQTYGLLSKSDIGVLHSCLLLIMKDLKQGAPISILEIGVWNGKTANGIREFVENDGHPIRYVGIENGTGAEATVLSPFRGARIIVADSISAREQIDDVERFDLVLIDGCHCLTHACMDFLRYQSLVSPGGYALFHDINPAFQGVEQHHANRNHAAMPMKVAVVEAIHLLGLADNKIPDWRGGFSEYEKDRSNGFFVARKTKPQGS